MMMKKFCCNKMAVTTLFAKMMNSKKKMAFLGLNPKQLFKKSANLGRQQTESKFFVVNAEIKK